MASPQDPSVPAQFARLVSDKRLIDAIKWLRETEGLDLQAAKEKLDTYLATGTLSLRASASARPGVSDRVRSFLNQGQMIEAIRLHHEESGLGLAEAKKTLDAVVEKDPILKGRMEDEKRARRRRILTWVVVSDLLVFGGIAYYFLTQGN
jgi:ribosomal protein L7/L12